MEQDLVSITPNVDVGDGVVGQGASGAAIDCEQGIWRMHQVTRNTMGPGEVFVHMLGRGASVDRGYHSKSLLSSGEDAENSGHFCSVWDSPHVGVI
jgi:hypothetical protein